MKNINTEEIKNSCEKFAHKLEHQVAKDMEYHAEALGNFLNEKRIINIKDIQHTAMVKSYFANIFTSRIYSNVVLSTLICMKKEVRKESLDEFRKTLLTMFDEIEKRLDEWEKTA